MLHLHASHNDIFLTHIIGCDKLIFSQIYIPKNDIVGTPLNSLEFSLALKLWFIAYARYTLPVFTGRDHGP